jgi:4-amino-4-deoxy-L-arabinose transferase-like glycosyltransferase
MPSELTTRIDAMLRRDQAAAGAFILVLWLVIGFVFFSIGARAERSTSLVLLAAGALLVLFNTASIIAMIRHHKQERARIYGLEIEQLDAASAARRAGSDAGTE